MASQTGLKEVVSLYQTLIKEWNRKPVDLEKVGKLLSGMKVSYILWVSPYFPAEKHETIGWKFTLSRNHAPYFLMKCPFNILN